MLEIICAAELEDVNAGTLLFYVERGLTGRLEKLEKTVLELKSDISEMRK